MGNLILLPNGEILCLNGAKTGTAGYGNTTYTVAQSYADQPITAPAIYNPAAPAGQRWTRNGLSPSTVPRMYHSSATLMPDGKPDGRLLRPLLELTALYYIPGL